MLSSCRKFQNISESMLLQASAGDCSSFEELSKRSAQAKGIPYVSRVLIADHNQLGGVSQEQ